MAIDAHSPFNRVAQVVIWVIEKWKLRGTPEIARENSGSLGRESRCEEEADYPRAQARHAQGSRASGWE